MTSNEISIFGSDICRNHVLQAVSISRHVLALSATIAQCASTNRAAQPELAHLTLQCLEAVRGQFGSDSVRSELLEEVIVAAQQAAVCYWAGRMDNGDLGDFVCFFLSILHAA